MRILLSALCLALLMSAPVLAAGTPSIAVVEMRDLVGKSDAAKNIGQQLEAHREAIFKVLTAQEKEIVAEEKTLIDERKDLSKEDFSKRVQALETKKIELQKMSIDRRNALNKASLTAEKKLLEEITKVVEGIAKEEGYDLVLTKQDVVVGSKSLEITDEALKRLNKAVSKIKVDLK